MRFPTVSSPACRRGTALLKNVIDQLFSSTEKKGWRGLSCCLLATASRKLLSEVPPDVSGGNGRYNIRTSQYLHEKIQETAFHRRQGSNAS
jgi:hypothetical protein